jgi:hypothetical protein
MDSSAGVALASGRRKYMEYEIPDDFCLSIPDVNYWTCPYHSRGLLFSLACSILYYIILYFILFYWDNEAHRFG